MNTPPQQRTEIHVYDRRAGREVEYEVGLRRFFDLADDALVWQEYRGTTWGIYGRHLTTGQPFTVTTQSASYPKIAKEWVAYVVRSKEAPEALASELRLFNWRTGEDKLIGLVSSNVDGAGYAMDGNSLAWVKVSFEPGTPPHPTYELHVYHLVTGQDRKADIGNDSYLTNLYLSDDLLIYLQSGWQAIDLRRDLKFDVFPLSMGWESLSKLAISDNRLVWVEHGKLSGAPRLYVAQIDRER